MQIDILTKQDLESFKNDLFKEIREILKPERKKQGITSNETRKLLSCSPAFLQNIRISGKIKGTKIGGKWYYEYSEIENLFNDEK